MLYRCYAKINLTLEILRRREDGYHDLASLVHTISLADDLRVEPAGALLTRVEGLVLDPETNLVARAAEALMTTTRARAGAELTLVKRIPAAAGLGGGSSDAATTLVGLNRLWGTRLGLGELAQVAGELGADVPFFLRGRAALMRGRGDDLTPLSPLASQWLVIVVPPHAVMDKTRRLYGALEPTDFTNGASTLTAADRLARQEPLRADCLVNAFARAARAVFPGLSEVWATAERVCERPFFLSGAGPALLALASDRADARRQLASLSHLDVAAHAARTVKEARVSLNFARASRIRYP